MKLAGKGLFFKKNDIFRFRTHNFSTHSNLFKQNFKPSLNFGYYNQTKNYKFHYQLFTSNFLFKQTIFQRFYSTKKIPPPREENNYKKFTSVKEEEEKNEEDDEELAKLEEEAKKSRKVKKITPPKNRYQEKIDINFDEGWQKYHEKDYEKALQFFIESLQANPQMPIIKVYIGDCLHQLKRCKLSLQYYNEFLQIDKRNTEILFKKSQILIETDQMELAIITLKNCVEISPENIKFTELLIRLLLKTANYEEALLHVNNLLKLKDDHIEGYGLKSQIYAGLRDYKKALETIEEGLNLYEGFFLLLAKAQYLYALKEYKESMSLCDKLLIRNPREQELFYLKARCLFKLDKRDDAISVLVILEANKHLQNENVKLNIIQLYQEFDLLSSAMSAVDRAIKKYPENHYFYAAKSSIFEKLGDKKQALGLMIMALSISPKNENYAEKISNFYFYLKDSKECIELMNSFIKIHPNNSNFYSIRGDHYYALNDLEKSLENYEKAIEMGGKLLPNYLKNKSRILLDLNQYSEALKSIDESIKLFRNSADSFYIRGLILMKLNSFSYALNSFENAISLFPYHKMSHYQIGLFYFFNKEIEKSKLLFEKCFEIDKNDDEMLVMIALCEHFCGNFQVALNYFDEILTRVKKSKEISQFREMTLKRIKNQSKNLNDNNINKNNKNINNNNIKKLFQNDWQDDFAVLTPLFKNFYAK